MDYYLNTYDNATGYQMSSVFLYSTCGEAYDPDSTKVYGSGFGAPLTEQEKQAINASKCY